MKNNVIKSLIVFCILNSACCGYSHAQIIYTDVNPDITIVKKEIYNLDLNNDGINDFIFSRDSLILFCGLNSGWQVNAGIQPNNLNSIALIRDAQNYGDSICGNFNLNSVIGSSLHYSLISQNESLVSKGHCRMKHGSVYCTCTDDQPWSFGLNAFVGLRIKLRGRIYYGWAHLDVEDQGKRITIEDYAYNSLPNQPILAGQKTDFSWIAASVPADSDYCRGSKVNVTYVTGGTFNASNIFTAQLSDTAGNFSNPVVIGSEQGTHSGVISAVIPLNAENGLKYRIRVLSSSPLDTSADNGTNIIIGVSAVISADGPTIFCPPYNSVRLSTPVVSGYTYQWLKNGIKKDNGTGNFFWAGSSGNYSCLVTSACGMETSNVITVVVNPAPQVNITPSGIINVCSGQSQKLTANSSAGIYYQWQRNGVDLSGGTFKNYDANRAGQYTVTVTDTNSNTCSSKSAPTTINSISCLLTPTDLKRSLFNIFPNSAYDRITLSFASSEKEEIQITNMLGQIVFSEKITPIAMRAREEIDVSQFPKGMYIVSLKSLGENFESKFLKQ